MKQLTKNFANEILNKGKGNREESKIFSKIFNSLEKVYGKDNVDLESIMTVISGLKHQSQIKENIGDLGLFFLNTKYNSVPIGSFKPLQNVLDTLESKFKRFIRKNVIIKPSQNIDRMREVYSDFFDQLCNVSDCAVPSNGIGPLNTREKWTFFTTNYDNSLEDYWVNHRNYKTLDLGFYRDTQYGSRVMDGEKLVENNKSGGYSAMQLIKLHGSINWIKNRDNKIEEHELNLSYDQLKQKSGSGDVVDDLMIYPLAQKHLYLSPFIQFFRILGAELDKRDIWIIVGYSFRDVIIRNMFEKTMCENGCKLIIVHPDPEHVQKLFSEKVRKHIVCLKCYFGRKDYKNVNSVIIDQLLKNS